MRIDYLTDNRLNIPSVGWCIALSTYSIIYRNKIFVLILKRQFLLIAIELWKMLMYMLSNILSHTLLILLKLET